MDKRLKKEADIRARKKLIKKAKEAEYRKTKVKLTGKPEKWQKEKP